MQRAELAAILAQAGTDERARLIAEHHGLLDASLAQAIKTSFDETKASRPLVAANAAAAIGDIAQAIDDAEVRALAAWTAGMVTLQQTGKTEQALVQLDRAAGTFTELRRPEQVAAVQVSRLHALAVLGRYDEAIAAGRGALELLSTSGDDLAAGKVEQNLGNIHWRREQYAEAEQLLRAARARFERTGDALQLAQVDNNLAGVLALQYRFAEASEHYELAHARADALGLEVTRAEVAVNLGCLALARGDYGRALAELEGARRRYSALELPHKLANAEKELADAYLELNLLPEAADLYERAIPAFEGLGMRAEVGWTNANQGRVLLQLGRADEAHERLVRARDVFVAEDNRVGEAMVTLAQAELHLRSGDDAAAADLARRAEELLSNAGTAGRLLLASWLRGETARRLGETAEAQRILTAAVDAAEAGQLPHVAQRCHTSLGLLAASNGDAPTARREFERAVELIEALGAPLPAEEFRTAFSSDKLVPYVELVRLALARGSQEGVVEAFDLVERARSRVLADLMADVPRDAAPTDAAEAELLARVDTLREELGWLYGRVNRQDGRRGDAGVGLETQVRAREAELMELRRRFAAARGAQRASRSAAASIPIEPGTVLVGYFSLDDELLAFVVHGERIQVARGLARASDVDEELAGLRFQLDSLIHGAERLGAHMPQLAERARRHLQRLYALLLRSLDPYLEDAQRLVIVPHRSLHYVPFHALHDGDRYAIERWEVVYAPSVAVLRHCLERPLRATPPRRAVLVGVTNAGAPGVRDEVARVADRFPEALTRIDGAATLSALRAEAPTADILHLATHGQFRPDNPLFSALRLADGWLTVRDACELDLSGCGLVALSACDTGVSQVAPGDELLGMVRGFFSSGAASLLVSLWPVDDATTVELMDCFYGRLQTGIGPAAALREAQRELLGRLEHPFYWAAFAVHGRW